MSLAHRTARATVRAHGRDPWRIAAALALPVYRFDLPKPHRELYVERRGRAAGLIIDQALTDARARELLAHGLAHHLLHVGDRVSGRSTALWSGRHEREADDFAAYLLIPDYGLRRLSGEDEATQVAELAELYGVSRRTARRRLKLAHRIA